MPASNNYLKQFLSWLLQLIKAEQRGIASDPILERIRNPRCSEGATPAYPEIQRVDRDSAGRDVPICTYRAVPDTHSFGIHRGDFWIICDRLGFRSDVVETITVGSGPQQIKVRVVKESGASKPNSGSAIAIVKYADKQPTHRIVIFEMSQIPDRHGIYTIWEIAEFELNLITSFKLHDAIARELTRRLAKKIFYDYPGSIDWLKEMLRERAALVGSF